VAVVGENYTGIQISRENFADIQQGIGWLVDELPDEVFTPRLVDSYWTKGAAIMVCHDKLTKTGWLLRYPPWWPGRAPGSGWWAWMLFPLIRERWPGFWAPWRIWSSISCSSVGWTGVWTLDTGEFMSARRKPMGSTLCSVLTKLLLPHWREWGGYPSVGQDKPSSPFWVPSQKRINKKRKKRRRKRRRRPNGLW
jgi:hypothetical protein